MTVREKQSLFARLLGLLIGFVFAHPGWELTLGEGALAKQRVFRLFGGAKQVAEDGVHMPNSLHYERLAVDLNLFVDGQYIPDGSHAAWVEIGEWWEAQHPLCRWGGRFGDANHVSLEHGGRA